MKIGIRIAVVVVAAAGCTAVHALDEDLYGEAGSPAFKERKAVAELEIVLPSYPRDDTLVEVELGLSDFPFRLLIDSASLTVGADRVVRYTSVLRSASGAENVVYEGLRCDSRQYRRYAFGANGQFRLIDNSEWKYIRENRLDRYRAVLHDEYFCPLPRGNREQMIIKKFKGQSSHRTPHVFE